MQAPNGETLCSSCYSSVLDTIQEFPVIPILDEEEEEGDSAILFYSDNDEFVLDECGIPKPREPSDEETVESN